MTHRHQLADTVVNGFSADPLRALQSESLITTGDPLSGIAAVRPSAPLSDPASNGGDQYSVYGSAAHLCQPRRS
ncbi:hypothetical protein KZ774_22530 [Escherichia coli]|nr:hypothetical protein [Escherichia coli]